MDNFVSSYSTAYFTEPRETDEVDLNMIAELNRESDVNAEYNLRQQLYETTEDFHDLEIIKDTPNEEIQNLVETVKKGQQLLKNEMIKYSGLKDHLEELYKKQNNFREQVASIRKSILSIAHMKEEVDEHESDIACLTNTLTDLERKVSNRLDLRVGEVTVDYEESKQKLLRLKDVYKILKNSDVGFSCPICTNKHIESFLLPCGHCFCNDCIQQIHNGCFLCRKPYIKVNSLYFC